jgi:hypothetical protein
VPVLPDYISQLLILRSVLLSGCSEVMDSPSFLHVPSITSPVSISVELFVTVRLPRQCVLECYVNIPPALSASRCISFLILLKRKNVKNVFYHHVSCGPYVVKYSSPILSIDILYIVTQWRGAIRHFLGSYGSGIYCGKCRLFISFL